jgi:hypothetical protein
MTSRLSLRAALTSVAATVALLGGGLLAQPASADGETEPPVAVDDSFTFYTGGADVLDVLRNDSDPQGAELAVCKVKVEANAGGYALLEDSMLFAIATGGDGDVFEFRYYACNDEFLTPATVTITQRQAKPLLVRKVPGRPGRLEVTNRNDHAARILFGGSGQPVPDGRGQVPADGTRVIKVARPKIFWIGVIGRENGDAGSGIVKHITVPDHASRATAGHVGRRLHEVWDGR